MARAAARGAVADPDVSVSLLTAPNTRVTDVIQADGYLFATPENLASMAGVMKAFFDRVYYPALNQLNGRPYAAMICAGSDGENAARQLARIVTGWRLKQIAPPLIARVNAQTPEAIRAPKTIPPADLRRCVELGEIMAAGLAAGIF